MLLLSAKVILQMSLENLDLILRNSAKFYLLKNLLNQTKKSLTFTEFTNLPRKAELMNLRLTFSKIQFSIPLSTHLAQKDICLPRIIKLFAISLLTFLMKLYSLWPIIKDMAEAEFIIGAAHSRLIINGTNIYFFMSSVTHSQD